MHAQIKRNYNSFFQQKPNLISNVFLDDSVRKGCHPRNLNDDQIRALAKKGGVMGLNFCPPFLGENIGCTHSQVGDMVRHITHILNVGGEDVLALGTDFDGIEASPAGISGAEDMSTLYEALLRRNYPEGLVRDIFYYNLLYILERAL